MHKVGHALPYAPIRDPSWLPLAASLVLFARLAQAATPPPNDLFANRAPLTGENASVQSSNTGATKELNEPNHAGDAGGKSVWWTWTAPSTGSAEITTDGSGFDTLLAVYTGTSLPALTLVAANDQDPLGIESDTSRVKFDAVAGIDYALVVDGWRGDSGLVQLHLERPPRPPNDRFEARTSISGTHLLAQGTNREATKEGGEPDHAGEPGGASV